MRLRSSIAGWGTLLRALHWGMLVLYGWIVLVGYRMVDLPLSMAKMKVYALHKSLGVLLLALALGRLLWRWADRGPVPLASPPWQRRAATATVVVLYGLMVVLPLSGWLYNSAAGFPLRWFNAFNLPALMGADPRWKPLLKSVHESAVVVFLCLVGLHALAAFKHHWMDRDDTLRRMLPLPGREHS